MDYTSNNDIIRNIDKVIKMGKEWLETEYIINKRPMSSIAKELDVYQIDVSKALKFFGLPARATCNGKDKSDIEKSMKLLQNYEWLYEKYYIDQLSITHISSNLLHLPPHKIRTQLKEFDIPIRSYSEQLSISNRRRANTEETKKEIFDLTKHILLTCEFGGKRKCTYECGNCKNINSTCYFNLKTNLGECPKCYKNTKKNDLECIAKDVDKLGFKLLTTQENYINNKNLLIQCKCKRYPTFTISLFDLKRGRGYERGKLKCKCVDG